MIPPKQEFSNLMAFLEMQIPKPPIHLLASHNRVAAHLAQVHQYELSNYTAGFINLESF